MTPDSSTIFDNPIVMTVVVGLIIGLAGGILGRLFAVLGRLTPAAAFLASYYLAYGAIPDFPPMASTAKIFYSVAGLAIVGLIFDDVIKNRIPALVWAALVPALLFFWIGYVRLTNALSGELIVIAIIFLIVGALAILWLRAVDFSPASASRGPVASISILLALAAGYAPIALVGGSSTSLGLLAGFAAGLGGLGLVQFIFPAAALGWTGVLSAFGALLAVNDSVTLINGKMDFLLLALLCPALLLGQAIGLVTTGIEAKSRRLGQLIVGVASIAPALLVIGLAYLRHADAFHP